MGKTTIGFLKVINVQIMLITGGTLGFIVVTSMLAKCSRHSK